jgi:hypothetical protein
LNLQQHLCENPKFAILFNAVLTIDINLHSLRHAVAQLVEALHHKPGSIPDGVTEIFH